jgi:hypothetical protein
MSRKRPFVTWTGSEDGLEKRPVICRRIFAEGNHSRPYVELYVWATLAELRNTWAGGASQGTRTRGNRRKVWGFWKSALEVRVVCDRLGRDVFSKKLGEIHLALNSAGQNTIAHEAYHATRYFARRMGTQEPNTLDEDATADLGYHSPEEVNARFMGHLTGAISASIQQYLASHP